MDGWTDGCAKASKALKMAKSKLTGCCSTRVRGKDGLAYALSPFLLVRPMTDRSSVQSNCMYDFCDLKSEESNPELRFEAKSSMDLS